MIDVSTQNWKKIEFPDAVPEIKSNGMILKYQYSGPKNKLKVDARVNKALGDCDIYRIKPASSPYRTRFYTHDLYQGCE